MKTTCSYCSMTFDALDPVCPYCGAPFYHVVDVYESG